MVLATLQDQHLQFRLSEFLTKDSKSFQLHGSFHVQTFIEICIFHNVFTFCCSYRFKFVSLCVRTCSYLCLFIHHWLHPTTYLTLASRVLDDIIELWISSKNTKPWCSLCKMFILLRGHNRGGVGVAIGGGRRPHKIWKTIHTSGLLHFVRFS